MGYDLEDFEVLRQIVKSGNFTAAAQSLGLRGDSVGVRLKKLEKKLGTKLLHRSTQKVRLTEAGKRYLQWYERTAQGLESTRSALATKQSASAPTPKETQTTSARFDIVVRHLGEMQWAATCRPFDLIVVGQDLPETLQRLASAIVAEQNTANQAEPIQEN